MPKKYVFIVVGVVIVILGVGGWYLWDNAKHDALPSTTDGEDVTLGYVLDDVPLATLRAAMPNLDRNTEPSDALPPETQALFEAKIVNAIASLKEDPTQGSEWLNLGLYYHGIGDYEGARIVWEFLVEVSPKDTVPLDNLGKLYHFTLKDFSKAESYFKQSIALNPFLLNPYLDLFDLYRYSYKTDTTAAVDILNQAAGVFPNNSDIPALLGGYYRDLGNIAAARTAFEQALDLARAANDPARIASLGEALAGLPR